MLQACKYFQLGEGIALVFEEMLDAELTLSARSANGEVFLDVSDRFTIKVDTDLIEMLMDSQNLYFAYSPTTSRIINFIDSVPIDRLLLGKIGAYFEMLK